MLNVLILPVDKKLIMELYRKFTYTLYYYFNFQFKIN